MDQPAPCGRRPFGGRNPPHLRKIRAQIIPRQRHAKRRPHAHIDRCKRAAPDQRNEADKPVRAANVDLVAICSGKIRDRRHRRKVRAGRPQEEFKQVCAAAAGEHIRAVLIAQRVIACAALKRVIAAISAQTIVSNPALQQVVAAAAAEHIIVRAPLERVAARVAVQLVVARFAAQQVPVAGEVLAPVGRARRQEIGVVAALQRIAAQTSVQAVGSVAPAQKVVARITVQPVSVQPAVQRVRTVPTIKLIRPPLARKGIIALPAVQFISTARTCKGIISTEAVHCIIANVASPHFSGRSSPPNKEVCAKVLQIQKGIGFARSPLYIYTQITFIKQTIIVSIHPDFKLGRQTVKFPEHIDKSITGIGIGLRTRVWSCVVEVGRQTVKSKRDIRKIESWQINYVPTCYASPLEIQQNVGYIRGTVGALYGRKTEPKGVVAGATVHRVGT